MRLVSALALLVAACSAGGDARSREVSGTLVVDGKTVTLRRCAVENVPLGGTRIRLGFDGGTLTLEDGRLYLFRGEHPGVVRGEPLVCGPVTGARVSGSYPDRPGFAHGTLEATCTSPAQIELDATLACGEADPEALRRLGDP